MEPESIIKEALKGKYEILHKVDGGGMATVYKARQLSLNRLIALKVVHQELVHNEEFIKRFLYEAQVCASLNHNNIVTVYDVGSAGTVHFMAMEYLEGVTLRDHIKKAGRLTSDKTARFLIPVAEALHYMHKRGIIHRDIKSSNIFITRGGRVVVMDFGIAFSKDRDPFRYDNSIFGTPDYMSPEQIKPEVSIDGRSDIWSLGVVMFECLTGRLPFQSDDYHKTLNRIENETPPTVSSINSRVPNWISSIAALCLVKDPSRRMPDGRTLARALRNKEKVLRPRVQPEQATRKISRDELKTRDKKPRTLSGSIRDSRKQTYIPYILGIVSVIIVILSLMIFLPLGSGSVSATNPNPPVPTTENKATVPTIDSSEPISRETDPARETGRYEEGEETDKEFEQLITDGDNYWRNREFENALLQYNKALEIESENIIIKDRISKTVNEWGKYRIAQGDNYLENKNFNSAIRYYREAKQVDPRLTTVADQKIRDTQEARKQYEDDLGRAEKERSLEEVMRRLGINMVLVENATSGNYRIGKNEVTQKLWMEIIGTNPSKFRGNLKPVENVSYTDVEEFIKKLNELTGMNFRLPTEAEWEYAARGGKSSRDFKYSGSDILSEVGWYWENSNEATHTVMGLKANELGIFDMNGNVWEWVQGGVLKGGGWMSSTNSSSITGSDRKPTDYKDYCIGFRICHDEL